MENAPAALKEGRLWSPAPMHDPAKCLHSHDNLDDDPLWVYLRKTDPDYIEEDRTGAPMPRRLGKVSAVERAQYRRRFRHCSAPRSLADPPWSTRS